MMRGSVFGGSASLYSNISLSTPLQDYCDSFPIQWKSFVEDYRTRMTTLCAVCYLFLLCYTACCRECDSGNCVREREISIFFETLQLRLSVHSPELKSIAHTWITKMSVSSESHKTNFNFRLLKGFHIFYRH